MWPGAYSFKEEIGLFLDFFKKQLKFLIEEIEKTEEAIEKKAFQLFDQDMKKILLREKI